VHGFIVPAKNKMSSACIECSVERGESIAKKAIIHLKDELLNFKKALYSHEVHHRRTRPENTSA
jgi:hypothetical protein